MLKIFKCICNQLVTCSHIREIDTTADLKNGLAQRNNFKFEEKNLYLDIKREKKVKII